MGSCLHGACALRIPGGGDHSSWSSPNFVFLCTERILLVLFLLAIRHIPHRTMQRSLFAALLLTCCASLVLGVVDPGLAARGGRLIGFTGSANTLGIFAFVLFALTLFVDVGLRIRIAAFASSLGCVVWSASRASAVAIVICLLGYLFLRKGLAAVFPTVMAAAITTLAVSHGLKF